MFKKILAFVIVLVVAASLLCTTVSAATLNVTCSMVGSDAKGERVIFIFKNTQTGEEIAREIGGIGRNELTDIPAGDYEALRCVNKRNEKIEYPIASMEKFFSVVEGENCFYTFRVGNSVELEEGAKEELEHAVKMDWLLLLAFVLVLALLVVWIIFAIMGRKNYRKKMIGRFFFHLMFGVLGFIIGFFAAGGDMNQILTMLMFAGFPFGCALAAIISYRNDAERGYYVVREGESIGGFCVRMLFILLLCALLGLVAMPVVIVVDIVKMIKTKE